MGERRYQLIYELTTGEQHTLSGAIGYELAEAVRTLEIFTEDLGEDLAWIQLERYEP